MACNLSTLIKINTVFASEGHWGLGIPLPSGPLWAEIVTLSLSLPPLPAPITFGLSQVSPWIMTVP